MIAARALEIEQELGKDIPRKFFIDMQEDGKDRAAYEAMKAVQRYRRYLLLLESRCRDGLDCAHDVCGVCGAHLDTDEACDCQKGDV